MIQVSKSSTPAGVIGASVPLADMFGYATDLRSNTQGRAAYSMQFSHYDQVPKSKADEIISKVLSDEMNKQGIEKGLLVGDAATRIKQTTMFDLPIVTKNEIQSLMQTDVLGGGKRTSR